MPDLLVPGVEHPRAPPHHCIPDAHLRLRPSAAEHCKKETTTKNQQLQEKRKRKKDHSRSP